MSDAQRKPANNLLLKLRWPSEHGALSGAQHVVMELQDVGGLAVASMSVPVEQLLQAMAQRLNYRLLFSLDGCASAVSDEISLSQVETRPIGLDQLVVDAVSLDMLDDEPRAALMLAEFRTRLLKSLELVDQAIASLLKL